MDNKELLFKTVCVLGIGTLLYKAVNKELDRGYHRKKEEEKKIQEEWHRIGWDAGYRAGQFDVMLGRSKVEE